MPAIVTRFYQVRNRSEWMRAWITDDGCLSILSDYGNYGHWWTSTGCEFRAFLCGLDAQYLGNKLADGRREYRADQTLTSVKNMIIHARRDGEMTAKQARREWSRLAQHGDLGTEFEFVAWYDRSKLENRAEASTRGIPQQLEAFIERLWPAFIEQLRAELALEAEQETA
jgi:hypothetical protein